LCSSTKTAWQALGKVNYERTEAEKGNVKFRRSLYFVRALKEGDVITENDIRSVRPGFGLPPKYYDKLIGSKLTQCQLKKIRPLLWKVSILNEINLSPINILFPNIMLRKPQVPRDDTVCPFCSNSTVGSFVNKCHVNMQCLSAQK
jgi:hypothetical protein